MALNLNSNSQGDDVVLVEGIARYWREPCADKIPEYVEKYWNGIGRIGSVPDGFALTYSVTVQVRPTRERVW